MDVVFIFAILLASIILLLISDGIETFLILVAGAMIVSFIMTLCFS